MRRGLLPASLFEKQPQPRPKLRHASWLPRPAAAGREGRPPEAPTAQPWDSRFSLMMEIRKAQAVGGLSPRARHRKRRAPRPATSRGVVMRLEIYLKNKSTSGASVPRKPRQCPIFPFAWLRWRRGVGGGWRGSLQNCPPHPLPPAHADGTGWAAGVPQSQGTRRWPRRKHPRSLVTKYCKGGAKGHCRL